MGSSTAASTPSAARGWPSRCSARATGARRRTWCGATGTTGSPLRAFDFSYYVENRDNAGNVVRSHKHFSCVMAQVDGAWPEVSITREGILEKALGLVGLGDIELESDEFNRRFALRSPDRRFAVTLVDARMIDFLLSTEARFEFFVKGRWVLVVSDPLSPELVPAFIGLAEAFVEHIPRVVYELWPSPFRDEAGRPLAAGDEGYGAALAAAELAEHDPWSVLRSSPYEALGRRGRSRVRPRRQRGGAQAGGSLG